MDLRTPRQQVVHRPAGTAPATWAMGSLFERLISPHESGAIDVALVTQPPGIATPLHRHTREAESLLILEGQMTYRAGDDLYRLSAGDFIHLPAGLPHAFRVTGATPVRFVALADPGGLFDLYDEVGLDAAERRLPGPDGEPMEVEIPRWNESAPRFGLEVLGPPLPEDG